MKTFWRYFFDQPVGLITVTIHPDNVPEDGVASSLIFTPPAPNSELILQEDVLVLIVVGHHRYESIVELLNKNHQMFSWSRNPLSLVPDGSHKNFDIPNEEEAS